MAADLDIDVGRVGLAKAPQHQQVVGEDGDKHERRQGVSPPRRGRPGAPPSSPMFPTPLSWLGWHLLKDPTAS
jgi:hypothetical protein